MNAVAVGIIVGLLIMVLVYIFWHRINDEIRRARLSRLLGGDLIANRTKIIQEMDKLHTPSVRDRVDRARVERANGNMREGAENILIALREQPGNMIDGQYVLDNVVGYFDDDVYVLQMVQMIDQESAKLAAKTASGIVKSAREQTDVPIEIADIALEKASVYKGDNQNAHDSIINNQIRKGIRLLPEPTNTNAIVEEIRQYYSKYPTDKISRINATVAKIISNNVPVASYGVTELYLLAAVWERSKVHGNEANADNIRDAVIDALADSTVNDYTVCANGRASRIFGALAGLDYDKNLSTVGDIGMWRNQIFSEVKDVITETTEEAAKIPELAAAAAEYSGENTAATEAEMDKFSSMLRDNITKAVKSHEKIIGRELVNKLLDECYVYAGV